MTDVRWFLVIYGGLLASCVCTSVVVWRIAQPSGTFARGEADLADVEIAALNGGPRLAAITAFTALRRSRVTQTLDGALIARGPLVDDAGQLERELFAAIRRSPGAPAETLVDDAAHSTTVRRIVERLTDEGLRLDGDSILWVTALWQCARAVAWAGAAGIVVFLTTGTGDLPALLPAGLLLAGAALLACWLAARRSGASRAGRELLNRTAGRRADELCCASGRPAFAVAMLGGAALWTADPGFAAALDIPTQTPTSWTANAAGFAAGWEVGCGGCGCGGCG